jgi:hypothetical protein
MNCATWHSEEQVLYLEVFQLIKKEVMELKYHHFSKQKLSKLMACNMPLDGRTPLPRKSGLAREN